MLSQAKHFILYTLFKSRFKKADLQSKGHLIKNAKIAGKITYTPDTPLTRQIMKKANSSFEAISNLAKFGTTWSEDLAPKLREIVGSDVVTSQFKVRFCLVFI